MVLFFLIIITIIVITILILIIMIPKMLSVNLIGNNGKVSLLLLIKGINFPIIWINNGNANIQPNYWYKY
jgi:hypothetical protein